MSRLSEGAADVLCIARCGLALLFALGVTGCEASPSPDVSRRGDVQVSKSRAQAPPPTVSRRTSNGVLLTQRIVSRWNSDESVITNAAPSLRCSGRAPFECGLWALEQAWCRLDDRVVDFVESCGPASTNVAMETVAEAVGITLSCAPEAEPDSQRRPPSCKRRLKVTAALKAKKCFIDCVGSDPLLGLEGL